jgi:integrase
MSIRHVNKNHFKGDLLEQPVGGYVGVNEDTLDSALRFVTTGRGAHLVDLTPLRDGRLEQRGGGRWAGAYTGRPRLISQLAPAFREAFQGSSRETVASAMGSLRTWWRLFDQVEATAPGGKSRVPAVHGVEDLSAAHRQLALDSGMGRSRFGPFARIADVTRRALGLRPLHWLGPENEAVVRHAPTFAQVKPVRDVLKRRWYATLSRWETSDALISGVSEPSTEEERLQLLNQQHLDAVIRETGLAWPPPEKLRRDRSLTFFYSQGFRINIMLRSRYPDISDVRDAFHLCLITTGWNPQTLLDLDVSKEFVQPHPKDKSRYLLTGYKERSKTEQFTEGLYKTQRSPGVILLTLMKRTEPLRAQLQADYDRSKMDLEVQRAKGENAAALDEATVALARLREGLRSPWLYAAESGVVAWLTANRYTQDGDEPYLDRLIDDLNSRRAAEQQIPRMTATDFRDAFAAFAYQESGGMVLFVMRALGHRRLSSTQRYLDNNLLNDQASRIFHTFSNALWSEIQEHGRLDPTVIAKHCADGHVTSQERIRLTLYRDLKRSRIGLGCKSPTTPPKSVAPRFSSDGKKRCSTHRCTLCVENAVVLPDSLDGLAMRFAELVYLKGQMPVATFRETSFQEELENTELALLGFDPVRVAESQQAWRHRIESGTHRPIDLELLE